MLAGRRDRKGFDPDLPCCSVATRRGAFNQGPAEVNRARCASGIDPRRLQLKGDVYNAGFLLGGGAQSALLEYSQHRDVVR